MGIFRLKRITFSEKEEEKEKKNNALPYAIGGAAGLGTGIGLGIKSSKENRDEIKSIKDELKHREGVLNDYLSGKDKEISDWDEKIKQTVKDRRKALKFNKDKLNMTLAVANDLSHKEDEFNRGVGQNMADEARNNFRYERNHIISENHPYNRMINTSKAAKKAAEKAKEETIRQENEAKKKYQEYIEENLLKRNKKIAGRAAIGLGAGLGGAYLFNKFRNKKEKD